MKYSLLQPECATFISHSGHLVVVHGLHPVPTQHMRGEIAVRDGPRPHPHTEPQPLRPNSCGTNIIETVHRTPLLNRDPGSDNDPVPPVTTTVVSHAALGNLAISTQPTPWNRMAIYGQCWTVFHSFSKPLCSHHSPNCSPYCNHPGLFQATSHTTSNHSYEQC